MTDECCCRKTERFCLSQVFKDHLNLAGGKSMDYGKERIIAHLNLYAVLPRLEELVKLDDEAKRIAAQMNLTIHFRVKDGPSLKLSFANGSVSSSHTLTGACDVGLFFPSVGVLNRMFKGDKKAFPVPYWVNPLVLINKIGDLKGFTKLMDIMPRYLKPSEDDLRDAAFRKKHIEMLFLLALSATAVIADMDPKMKKVAGHLKDGTMLFSVLPEGPDFNVTVRGGHIEAKLGKIENPSATVEIRDIDLAIDMLNDRVDTFACTGSGDLRASGALNLVDEYNALLDRVGYFSAQM